MSIVNGNYDLMQKSRCSLVKTKIINSNIANIDTRTLLQAKSNLRTFSLKSLKAEKTERRLTEWQGAKAEVVPTIHLRLMKTEIMLILTSRTSKW